jgi:hypothetical protein
VNILYSNTVQLLEHTAGRFPNEWHSFGKQISELYNAKLRIPQRTTERMLYGAPRERAAVRGFQLEERLKHSRGKHLQALQLRGRRLATQHQTASQLRANQRARNVRLATNTKQRASYEPNQRAGQPPSCLKELASE